MLRNTQQVERATTTEVDASPEAPVKSRRVKFLQGAAVFVVMFLTLYTVMRWASARDGEAPE